MSWENRDRVLDLRKLRPLRHLVFKMFQAITRAFMLATLGPCIEQSPAGGGTYHRCVLWRGHRTRHRSATGALWSPTGRPLPKRISYAKELPRSRNGSRLVAIVFAIPPAAYCMEHIVHWYWAGFVYAPIFLRILDPVCA